MRPIDADELLNTRLCFMSARDNEGDQYIRLDDVIMAIRQAPTLDVETVTRCKDCQCFKARRFSNVGRCCISGRIMRKTGFCSEGLKKTGV